MTALAAIPIARAFEAACRAELSALKPGNVHIFAAGHGMAVAQFEQAAAAAAPAIAQPGAGVGARIRAAVEASLAVAGCNTNLGIILLCAPLAAAAEAPGPGDLRARLAAPLAGLDVEDAREAFRAIAAASPGGLGEAGEADVRAPAAITLRAAMALAADRDRIARQYVSDYADIFGLGLPALREAVDGWEVATSEQRAAGELGATGHGRESQRPEPPPPGSAPLPPPHDPCAPPPAEAGRGKGGSDWVGAGAAMPGTAGSGAVPSGTDRPPIAGAPVHDAGAGLSPEGEAHPSRMPGSANLLAPARVEAAYFAFLCACPDSHIARKFGGETAEAVRAEASAVRASLAGLAPDARHARLLAFDTSLKARGLNPGTSADLTVATVFAALLEQAGS